MTFCKNCGTKLNPQDEFCPNCGTKNETPQQPQQPDGMGADAVTAVPGGKKPPCSNIHCTAAFSFYCTVFHSE